MTCEDVRKARINIPPQSEFAKKVNKLASSHAVDYYDVLKALL